jgi:hypothetical protein
MDGVQWKNTFGPMHIRRIIEQIAAHGGPGSVTNECGDVRVGIDNRVQLQ